MRQIYSLLRTASMLFGFIRILGTTGWTLFILSSNHVRVLHRADLWIRGRAATVATLLQWRHGVESLSKLKTFQKYFKPVAHTCLHDLLFYTKLLMWYVLYRATCVCAWNEYCLCIYLAGKISLKISHELGCHSSQMYYFILKILVYTLGLFIC